jgi:hypothetical protein
MLDGVGEGERRRPRNSCEDTARRPRQSHGHKMVARGIADIIPSG